MSDYLMHIGFPFGGMKRFWNWRYGCTTPNILKVSSGDFCYVYFTTITNAKQTISGRCPVVVCALTS